MRVSREKLRAEGNATGFRLEILEKVIHLFNLLEGFNSHPFLRERLALKGGTALNLFVFNVPRLSVDIDLNYVGSPEREVMLTERSKVEEAVRAVCSREGFSIRRSPEDHAGGKWFLQYDSALGQGGNLHVDLNFMYRTPLWPIISKDSWSVGSYKARGISLVDIHELAAGKLTALLARHAGRDLFDAHLLLTQGSLDPERLRLGFVVYGAMTRLDWRCVSVDRVSYEAGEIEKQLLPLLRKDSLAKFSEPSEMADRLVEETRQRLEMVLPFSSSESEFLNRLLDHGEIVGALLTRDESLVECINHHPLLKWKAQNVRRFKGK